MEKDMKLVTVATVRERERERGLFKEAKNNR